MMGLDSAVRRAITESYLERQEPPPMWLTYPVIFHIGLVQRLQYELQVKAQAMRSTRNQRRLRRK